MKSLNLFILFAVIVLGIPALSQNPNPNSQLQGQGRHTDEVKAVKLYPNPAIEYVNVKFDVPQAKSSTFVIHNILGSALETEVEFIDEFEARIKVKDLSSGMYLMSISNEHTGLKGAYKFIKK